MTCVNGCLWQRGLTPTAFHKIDYCLRCYAKREHVEGFVGLTNFEADTLLRVPRTEPLLLVRLRALRLWHWQKAMKFRNGQRDLEEFKSRSLKDCTKRYDNYANEHLTAVQTLNEFFDIGDTAERDDVNATD